MIFRKLKLDVLFDTENPLLNIDKNTVEHISIETYVWTFVAALFSLAFNCKQSISSQSGELTCECQHIHAREYYLTTTGDRYIQERISARTNLKTLC